MITLIIIIILSTSVYCRFVEVVESVYFRKCMCFLRKTKMLFFSSCPWSGLGRNRLQEKWPVVHKKHQDIHDLFILAFVAFTLQRYCGLPTRKAKTSCLRKFSSPSGSNSRASLAFSALQPHFAGSVKAIEARTRSMNV